MWQVSLGVKLQNFIKLVEAVDLTQIDEAVFKRKSVGCIILTKDLKILLQMRGESSGDFPGCLSTLTNAVSKYTELGYVYFWHDHLGTISGCYEYRPLYFDDIDSVITHPNVMDYVCWLLEECKKRGLLA